MPRVSGHDRKERLILGCQGYCRNLGLISHLRQEECDQRRAEYAEAREHGDRAQYMIGPTESEVPAVLWMLA